MDFLAERDRLVVGDATDSGSVIARAFRWPRQGWGLWYWAGLVDALDGAFPRPGKRDTVALFPLGSTKGAYPFGIAPLEVLPGAPLPKRACTAVWYGILENGHAVAFEINGELYFPTGPLVSAPMWAPSLRNIAEPAPPTGA